jgi:lipid-A-disaccharide synthase
MKYFLIAGEASGDLHAANLMAALKNEDKDAQFRFFGGDLMLEQGGTLLKHYREMAYMGFIPVLMNLRTILRNMQVCKDEIRTFQPDVVILVDYPGFNLKIAKFVKTELQIPVHYYISPKIWAWKEYRINDIKRYIDKMYSILPFEVPFYQKHNYRIDYVGNPSLDEIYIFKQAQKEKNDFRERNLLSDKPIVALLAGSRKQEIDKNLPLMLEVARSFPDYQFVIAGAPGIEPHYYQPYLKDNNIRIVFSQTYPLLFNAQAALVTSGTATLETALLNVPQAVCYYQSGGFILYSIVEKILKVPYVSLVNLIANRSVVKELLGYKASVRNITNELNLLLNDPEYRIQMLSGYREIEKLLGEPGAPKHAANLIIKELMKSGKTND